MTEGWVGPSLQLAIGLVFVLLLVFQLIALVSRNNLSSTWDNYRQRIKTWWLILLPITLALLLGPIPLLALWCLIGSWAVYEMLHVASLDPSDKKLEGFLIASPWLLVCGLWIGFPWFWMMSLLLLPVPLSMIIQGHTHKFLERMSYLQWILIQIVGALSFGALLIAESPGSTPEVGSAGIFVWVLFVTQLHDAMQYCSGKIFGKHPILPKISPKKTWEGLLGGLLITSSIGALALSGMTFTFYEGFFIAALVCLSGFWSDVMMSAIKRGLGIKDYGSLLKGHGGLLDRIDSLLLALPIAYFLLTFIS